MSMPKRKGTKMIRTKFETSIYGNTGKNEPTIGEVAGVINSIRGIVKDQRSNRRQEHLAADDNYLNEVFSRNFNGWDGQNAAEFQRRNQSAIGEVARDRSSLYANALGFSSLLEDTLRKRQTGTLGQRRSLADEFQSQPQPVQPYNPPHKRQTWAI
jgi:hypothetical protein